MFAVWTKVPQGYAGYKEIVRWEDYPETGVNTRWKFWRQLFKQIFMRKERRPMVKAVAARWPRYKMIKSNVIWGIVNLLGAACWVSMYGRFGWWVFPLVIICLFGYFLNFK